MILVQRASDRLEFGRGRYQVRRVLPGLCLQNPNDPGFGPLGAFDDLFLHAEGNNAASRHVRRPIAPHADAFHRDERGKRNVA